MHTDNKESTRQEKRPITELFFSLIRCGIGKEKELPYVPTPEQWHELFDIAGKQTLSGIAFAGIKELPQEQRPPKEILLRWIQISSILQKKNAELNKKSALVAEKFLKEGFRNCILKGQGVAQLYPDPTLRTPGDIDIWLEGGSDKILQYVKQYIKELDPVYHHIDFPVAPGLDIEVHFTPSWMYSPIRNKRLQKFFSSNSERQYSNIIKTGEGQFYAPTLAFNRIYILLHIYRHLFQEGIGLRQMLDYYFVLDKGFTPEEKQECAETLNSLGLKEFAAAATYVLNKIFSLTPDKFIVQPDKRRGEFLLNEIMAAGNFGQYDKRYSIVSKESEFKHFLNSMQRITRLIAQYPQETLWSPYFKIWHWLWRIKRQNKNKTK